MTVRLISKIEKGIYFGGNDIAMAFQTTVYTERRITIFAFARFQFLMYSFNMSLQISPVVEWPLIVCTLHFHILTTWPSRTY